MINDLWDFIFRIEIEIEIKSQHEATHYVL